MKLIDTIEKQIVKNSKIYIIPTKQGFLYIGINFALFLIGLTYANNFTLLISFILFIFVLMCMFHTHQIMEQLNNPQIQYRRGNSKTFRLMIKDLNELISVRYYFNRKKYIDFNRTMNKSIFKPIGMKRGLYKNQKFQFYTKGLYNLFFVWTYKEQRQDLFIYPTPLFFEEKNLASEQLYQPTGHDEFSHHNPYRKGENSKRIDWKVFARTKSLYSKKYTHENPIGLKIDYHKIPGNHEEKLSRMAFSVESTKIENNKFELILPNTSLSLDKGESHRIKSLEALSTA